MRVPKSIFVALFLVAICTTAAVAQNTPGEFLVVYNIQVKPGANAQFEEFVLKIKEAAEKTGSSLYWGASQVTFGGPGNAYVITLRLDKWGDMDDWDVLPMMLQEAFGEEETAKILRSGGMAQESSETSISRLMKDLSYNLKSLSPAPMFRVRVSEVKREMQDDYLVFVAKLNEAWEKAGDNRTVIRRASAVGPGMIFTSATPFEKWSEWDDRGDIWDVIEKAHGPTEARRLRDALQNSLVSSQNFTIMIRPDLSRVPTSSTSND